MAFCNDDIKVYGTQFDQTSPPGVYGIGGVAAFYKKVAFNGAKTKESVIHFTYTGTPNSNLAYRLTGRTDSGMVISEDLVISLPDGITSRNDFRYLDKVEKLCNDGGWQRVITDGYFLDISANGHIDTKRGIEKISDGQFILREETVQGIILCVMDDAENNQAPDDATNPGRDTVGEEVLIRQRPFYDVRHNYSPYTCYQKVFLANLATSALNNGKIILNENTFIGGTIAMGTDRNNNGSLGIDEVTDAPAGVAFASDEVAIPGAEQNSPGTMDINEIIGIWFKVFTAGSTVLNFDINMNLQGYIALGGLDGSSS